MIKLIATAALLGLIASAATGQAVLAPCVSALDGVVGADGCTCGYQPGTALAAHAAGWRWTCDLLRGPGPIQPASPAGAAAAPSPDFSIILPRGGHGRPGTAIGY
jgi:hypothetical protein